MLRAMICARFVLGMVFLLFAAHAYALGGSASGQAGSGLSTQVVMVLSKRGTTCSGTVIAPDVILTAGHCVLCRKSGSAKNCVLASDKLAIAYNEQGSPVLQQVKRVSAHPRAFSDLHRSIDIAMIELAQPLPKRFVPVPLADANMSYIEGSDILLAGYGFQRNKDPKSAGTLRSASALVLSPQTRRIIRVGRTDSPDSLRICVGDSGGPVFTGDGRLAAVTFGTEVDRPSDCSTVGQAIKIAPVRAWIDGNLRKWR
jgi:secreted trypsin-like serine protease